MNIEQTQLPSGGDELDSKQLPSLLSPVQRDASRFLDTLDALSLEGDETIKEALYLSIAVHSAQEPRPDGTPYPCHPIQVALHVIETFGVKDKDVIIAALLHNAVEDQAETLASRYSGSDQTLSDEEKAYHYIEEAFGVKVSETVRGLSNLPYTPTPGISASELRDEKNKHYIDHVIDATSSSEAVFIVKLADFFENGLNSASLDEPLRSKLLCKYSPLFDYFVDSLEALPADALLFDKKVDIVRRIEARRPQ